MKKRIVLFIDTSGKDSVKAFIEVEGMRHERISETRPSSAQMILPLIKELLEKQHLTLYDITQINVNTGPGSFTGLRVGVAVANTLGTLLEVPVNGNPAGNIVLPHYMKHS